MSNLQNTKKYAYLTLGAIILMVVLIVFSILNNNSSPKTSQKILTKEQFIQKLPYTSPEFGVIYNSSQQTFYVNILKPPYEQNRQEAIEWIKAQGAEPTTLKIFYTPSSQFKSLNPK